MPKYTVDYLYNEFKALAGMRKGHSAYTNDDGYWDDGRCGWGGYHRLKEDCQTMAREFTKMDSLDDKTIAEKFKSCTKKDEFDFEKNNLNRTLNELSSGLHIRTGASSSMFGVCCIWGQQGMSHHVDDKLQECRRDVDRLKSQLENTKYEWVAELKRVQLEIREIEARMEENKRKAAQETDPVSRAKLIQLIENDGELLKSKYEERNQYTDKFKYINISKHISGLVEKLKKAVGGDNKGGSGGSGGGGNPNKPNRPNSDPNNPFGGNGGSGGDKDNKDPKPPRGKKEEKKEKDNSQMLLIIVAVIVIFFLMSQKDSHSSHRRDYEEFDYY